jgi:hypothetical protein
MTEGNRADANRYSPARQQCDAAGGRISRLEKGMQTLIYSMVLIAVLYWTGLFWWKVGRWFYLHGRDTRRRVTRLKDAAMAAYREGEFRGDAEHP